jgi:hypothetical protein
MAPRRGTTSKYFTGTNSRRARFSPR